MIRRGRLRVTAGFLLLISVLYWLDEGVDLLGRALLLCAAHELGHYLMGRALGGRLQWLSLSAVGAEMKLTYPGGLSYGRELAVALAGPSVNLALGFILAGTGKYLPAGLSFVLGVFNLLPILPLDGGQALWCALAALSDEDWADRALTVTAGLLTGVLAGAGVFLAAEYANFTLLIPALWLLWGSLRKKDLQFSRACGKMLRSKKGRSSAGDSSCRMNAYH